MSTGENSNSMDRLFERGLEELTKAGKNASSDRDEETTKILGFIEVPKSIGGLIDGLWNEGVEILTEETQQATFNKFKDFSANQLRMAPDKAMRSATLATIGFNAALKSINYINPVYTAFREHYQAKRIMARDVAPLLDDSQGSHSVGALMRSQNEMVVAHRQRMMANTKNQIKNTLTRLLLNVVPGMTLNTPSYKRMWHNQPLDIKPTSGAEKQLAKYGKRIVNISSGPLTNLFIASNDRQFKRKFTSEFSALEMVLELQKQTSEDSKASSFSLPGRRGGSLSLEKYIAKIVNQHQKDMADIYPDHTELRQALNEEVEAAVKPLVAGIRAGNISALSLAQLIGEGQVIKRKGRAIATPEEIQEHIAKLSGKPTSQASVDVKEYYKEASFTREELAKTLSVLEGEEKQFYTSMFPSEVLEDAGMSKEDVAATRESIAQEYGAVLCAFYLGLNQKSDEELAHDGLAKHEIKQVRSMAGAIEKSGEEAVSKLKNNPGHSLVLANWAVHTVNGQKEHFGTVLKEGRELLAKQQLEAANDEDKPKNRVHAAKAEKYDHSRSAKEDRLEAANDADEYPNYQSREDHRRASGDDLELGRGEF